MGRSPCCAKEGLNKGAWTVMEDKILIEYIKKHGEGRWRNLPKKAGLKRCGKSCRLRWMNYLRPDIKRGNITLDEEDLIIRLHKLLGNRWSLIAGRLPGRTDNEIKNYWNANLSKRVKESNNQTPPKTLVPSHQKKPRNKVGHKQPLSTIDEPNTVAPLVQSNAIRTKAIRCTKVFINPRNLQGNNTVDAATIVQPSFVDCKANEDTTIDHNNSSPILNEEYKIPSSEFMVGEDFFTGNFDLTPELLNSDFSRFCEFSIESSNGSSDLLLSPYNSPEQHPFVLTQELLEDWLGDKQLM